MLMIRPFGRVRNTGNVNKHIQDSMAEVIALKAAKAGDVAAEQV